MIKCEVKNCKEKIDEEIHLHHIIPISLQKFWGVKNNKSIYICKKHHDILHKLIPNALIPYIEKNLIDSCIFALENQAEWFINNFKK